jgi:hypothetical protein
MRRPTRLNLAALRENLLPRVRPAAMTTGEMLAAAEGLTLSRRKLFGLAGAAAVGMSPALSALDVSPFEMVRGDKRVTFRLDGRERWVIDTRRFGGAPRLEVNQNSRTGCHSMCEARSTLKRESGAVPRFGAGQEPARRVLLILPAPEDAEVEIFLLDGNRAMRRAKLPREKTLERLRPLLSEFFFGPKKPAGEPAAEPEREELQIARSWLEHNADRVNAFDVDFAGGLEGTLALLDRYLHEPPGAGKVFHV